MKFAKKIFRFFADKVEKPNDASFHPSKQFNGEKGVTQEEFSSVSVKYNETKRTYPINVYYTILTGPLAQ